MMRTPRRFDRRQHRRAVAALVLALVGAEPAAAQTTDRHALFEQRCQKCHGHSGEFAQAKLRLGPDGVTGGDGRPLEQFLRGHAGGLEPDQIDALLALFAAQIASGAMFRDRCGICHDRAYEFARLKLIRRDATLYGRYTGREVGPFLTGHGRLTAPEAQRMTQILAAIQQGGR